MQDWNSIFFFFLHSFTYAQNFAHLQICEIFIECDSATQNITWSFFVSFENNIRLIFD